MSNTHTEQFDWNTDPSVVVRARAAVAVYANVKGDITILQERQWNDDDDTVIVVPRELARAVAAAIINEAKALEAESKQARVAIKIANGTAPKDGTAAERQRRRRQRQRDAVTLVTSVTPVTPMNGHASHLFEEARSA